uniref:Thioredoxin domain-containing protein n=1 Tax=Urocitellus parryii TaxID=9999 RepID=A0A8D2KJA5_UROPR
EASPSPIQRGGSRLRWHCSSFHGGDDYPCKIIKPFFHSLSEKYPNVLFLEIDRDDCQSVAKEREVKCMPTFQFLKKGQKVGEFSGANKEKLEDAFNEFV